MIPVTADERQFLNGYARAAEVFRLLGPRRAWTTQRDALEGCSGSFADGYRAGFTAAIGAEPPPEGQP